MKTVGIRSAFDLIDKNTVHRLIKEKRLLLPKKELDPKKDKPWNVKKINSQMLQGIMNGEDISTIARRIQSVVQSNADASIRTARTMCTASENLGRMDMLHEAQEMGLEVKKVWLATSDNRTRDWHAELDGVEKEVDEPFITHIPTKNGMIDDEIQFPGDPEADPANTYNCRCTLTYEVVGYKKGESGEELSSEQERETYAERRRERLATRRQASVNFDTAPISDVQKYAETKLKTNIDFKGATEQAKRGIVKAVDRFEKAGGTVGNAKVVFGGTSGNYGYYDPKTNTIHLRKNANFAEKMLEENARSMFKLGKPRWADPTYEGLAAHELGHAFDRYFGQEISREISRRGLLREAFSISSYAATEPAIGAPRASEAVAENIAAYLAGGAEKEKISQEIIKILEKYFGKRK